MTKRGSEAEFGVALRDADVAAVAYRLPDPRGPEGVTNWKPCDYMTWTKVVHVGTPATFVPTAEVWPAWWECKDVDAVDAFPFAELRKSQVLGIREAVRIGIPYWLAVYWRRSHSWTISDAAKVLAWRELHTSPTDVGDAARPMKSGIPTSIPRELLMVRFGVDSSRANLASTIKNIMLGEI